LRQGADAVAFSTQGQGDERDAGRFEPDAIEAAIPAASKPKEKNMSKPTHSAYIVIPPKEGSEKKPVWRKVGAVWPHTKGNGFDLVVDDQLSVAGRIVVIENKDEEPEPLIVVG
jgi:hypothetical protein